MSINSLSINALSHGALVGKHALVTGGAQGIGLAIAKSLLLQAASVSIAGRTEASLQAAVLALQDAVQADACLGYVLLDVSDAASVAASIF
jgi:NAD(P)-dependent dehydrogenase (short-subunit alcohol dehydrogenase family)